MTTTPPAIQQMLDWQKEHAGQVVYSETASTRLAHATAADLLTPTDCSGNYARLMAFFGHVDVGTYTGNEDTHGILVTTDKARARAGVGMLPGDGILFDWNGDGKLDHIAMYAGSGRIWNHGGPGKGPLNWSLADNVNNAKAVMVRRYIQPLATPAKPDDVPAQPTQAANSPLESDMLVQFIDAPNPTEAKAVFLVNGGTRIWLSQPEYEDIETKLHLAIVPIKKHALSHLYLLPVVGPVPK